jgi:hypothetical protein
MILSSVCISHHNMQGMGLALVPCHLTGLWNDDLSVLGTSWAWCFFAMNTVMTGSIVLRIQ